MCSGAIYWAVRALPYLQVTRPRGRLSQDSPAAEGQSICSSRNASVTLREHPCASLGLAILCAASVPSQGVGRVVYGCPAETLGEISGEEMRIDCRQVMSSGILHKVDVVGPVLGDEAAAQHRAFWPRFLSAGNPV